MCVFLCTYDPMLFKSAEGVNRYTTEYYSCFVNTFSFLSLCKAFTMKYPFILIFLFLQFAAFTQGKEVNIDKENPNPPANNILFASGAIPNNSAKYVTLTGGSPYFSDSWMKGKVVLSNGAIADSLRGRLDLLAKEFQYKGRDGVEMTASVPLKSIMLVDSIMGNQYVFVHSSYMLPAPHEKGWYQLLTAGNASLYKLTNKKITETKPYGSSVVEQSIITTEQYFVFTNSTYTKVKKLKDIPDILSNKSNDLSRFISSRKLSGKSEQDFIDVVAEYNSLLQK
jgi:hypothetical protein